MNNVMRNLRDILDLGLWERRAVCYYSNRTSFSRTVCAGRSDSRLFVFVCVCLLDDRAPPSEVVNAVARIMTGYGFNQNPLELLGTGDIDRYTHTLMFFCYIHRCNGFLSLVSSFSLWPFLLLVQTFALDCCRISRLYYLDKHMTKYSYCCVCDTVPFCQHYSEAEGTRGILSCLQLSGPRAAKHSGYVHTRALR